MTPKERIIQEAAAMFLDEGIKSVRMDDIATKLGVSKRTLYELFGDKKELLHDCMAWHFEQRRQDVVNKTSSATNVLEQIFMMIDAMKHEPKELILVQTMRKFHPDIYHTLEAEGHRFSIDVYEKLLDRGMREKLFLPDLNKNLTLLALTYSLTAMIEERNHFKLVAENREELFRYVLINFFRGLSTHKGIEVIDDLVVKYRNKKK